ncbi:MAG: hypothetical protein ACRDNE_11115 [Gaiellaceae bacterium]
MADVLFERLGTERRSPAATPCSRSSRASSTLEAVSSARSR